MKENCSCDISKKWSGIEANVEHLREFENRMIAPDGTVERIWHGIESKASKALVTTIMIVIIGFVGTLFTLVYTSNQEILSEFAEIKEQIAGKVVFPHTTRRGP